MINDGAVGGGREKAICMHSGRPEAFEDIVALQKHGLAAGSFPVSEAAVSLLLAQEHFDGITEKRVVRGYQGDIFTSKGEVAIESSREPVLGKFREILAETFSLFEDVTPEREVLDLEPKVVKESNSEFFELGIMIRIRNMLDQTIGAI